MMCAYILISTNIIECPRKIRDKEQSDVNEFLEWHIVHIVKPFFRLHHSSAEKEGKGKKAKVSSDGSKARGGNCDTRLDWCALYKKNVHDINNLPPFLR